MGIIKIALTDDHLIVTEGLSKLLSQQNHFNVINTYNSGAELLEGIKKELPDILLLDIHLPDIRGNELVRILYKQYPQLKIIALTSIDNFYDVRDMMNHGCSGYLLKSSPMSLLKEAIKTVYAGGQFIAPNLKEQLLANMLGAKEVKKQDFQLTQREQTILKLLSEGKTNNEIAAQLFLSHRTIENNRLLLYQKMDVHNTASLIKVALQRGLI